jgi:hypothetical protein
VTRGGLTETQALAGDISQYLFDEWCRSWGEFRFGCRQYEALTDEDWAEAGFDPDDGTMLIIRRKEDGKLFEVELEAHVYEVPSKEEREKRAEQARVLLERYKAAEPEVTPGA